jgi:hypothetical protein
MGIISYRNPIQVCIFRSKETYTFHFACELTAIDDSSVIVLPRKEFIKPLESANHFKQIQTQITLYSLKLELFLISITVNGLTGAY